MILADTSVWVDHLRFGDTELERRLLSNEIVCHPFIVAEIALGSLKNRSTVLSLLDGLAHSPTVETNEVRYLTETRGLYSRGIGFVDAALLASCLLDPGTRLWTRDRRLNAVAKELDLAFRS
ncbi:type II toxin-antitoxin system VapC family toxin [Acuticoccus sediminis]|uniref:type II toxin-antitoxin system VapC family toxin n=1 Tax=Acuticoccus sediminis TaxID=2184697 RepID=UPI001CFC81FD|nr:PIN domain-containing protein [Acuticoccus sediminis]